MRYTSSSFDRRLAAFDRAESGRFGRPLSDLRMARVALARRMLPTDDSGGAPDPATVSNGPALLLQR